MKCKRGFYDDFVRTCAKYPSRVAMRSYDEDEECYKCYTYSELYGVCEYIAQQLQQLDCNKGVIGLVCTTNIIIPCVVAAAHKCCTSFMFLDPANNMEEIVEDMKFTVIISIMRGEENIRHLHKPPDKCLSVFGLSICFYNYSQLEFLESYIFSREYSFIAMTSGTTGKPKKIQVPVQCIQPNITDLTSLFHITPEDVIYFSTPLTFDPSMVEILLACTNGASLLIAPPKVEILFPKKDENSVTVWQTTPSKFFQFSNVHIKNRILNKKSTLRILALGGEPLYGVKRLKDLKHVQNKTKIFSLYGVTEMSCWACVAELNLNKMKDTEVPLGKCLSETKIVVDSPLAKKTSGKIVLVSDTRKCIILSKSHPKSEMNSLKFVDTGDLTEVKNNGTLYYRGRKDDVIKRFGHKINLQLIESTIMHCPRIKASSCLWLPKPKLLVVYFSSETFSSQDLSDFLKCKLDDKHWPDRIVRVDSMPTTTHGKISKIVLKKLLNSDSTIQEQSLQQSLPALKIKFLQEAKATLKSNMTYDEIKNQNWYDIGGSSFLAVTLCNLMSLIHPEYGRYLLPQLMSQSLTIDQALDAAEKMIAAPEQVFSAQDSPEHHSPERHSPQLDTEKPTNASKKMKTSSDEYDSPSSSGMTVAPESSSLVRSLSLSIPPTPDVNLIEFTEMWTYNTGKCVDASPSVIQLGLNLYVAVGSHSGKVVVVDAMTAIEVGVIVMKSRVEAAVCCYPGDKDVPPCGIVGAYNGTVVCFAIESCEELWRANTGAMIKSKAVCNNGLVYVASYDGCIRGLDLVTGQVKHMITVGEQAISADLVLAKDGYLMVGNLGGQICGVHTESASVAWRSALESPVFASPAVYDERKYVVFAEVRGEVHCFTAQKGIKIWTYSEAKGNIFSSLAILQINNLKFQMVFGCYDTHVYSIHVDNFEPSPHWDVALCSSVYSTPVFLNEKLILAASNNGKLTVISAEYGTPLAEYNLPGETFSSPAVYKDYIFIGCRNDLVYSLRYVFNL
ncbi:AMP-binding enzyme domain-containing protein [Phthorimaea operculella]|nr:AMP-binding enzyme domain-containing protein [Phthorimaea operculella]